MPIKQSIFVILVTVAVTKAQFFYDDDLKLESKNYPGRFMGFTVERAIDGQMNAYLTSSDDRRFYLRLGLTGEEGTVAFESSDFKGYYLRHYGTELDLEKREGSRNQDIFDEDATYWIRPDKWFPGYLAFESVNFPDRYIRHRGNRLYVESYQDTTLYKEDASWRLSKGPFILQPLAQSNCFPPCRLSRGLNEEAVVAVKGTYMYSVSPGLYGETDSTSFVLASQPNIYLRKDGSLLFFENASDIIRNPESFARDASFFIRKDAFRDDSSAIEASEGSLYVARQSNTIGVARDDFSEYFLDDASFKALDGPLLFSSSDGSDQKITINDKSEGVMSSKGTRFNIIYPGLTGTPGTVSFENYELDGQFIRHYEYDIAQEDALTGRNPELFKQDSTFYLRVEFMGAETVSFESVNYEGYFICQSGNRLVLSQYEDSDEFRAFASFKRNEAPTDIERQPEEPVGPNTTAIIASCCTVGVIIFLIFAAFFVDRLLNKRKMNENSKDEPKQSSNQVPDDGLKSTGVVNPIYESNVPSPQNKGNEYKVEFEPLPSVSQLAKDTPKDDAYQSNNKPSFLSSTLRRLSSTNGQENEEESLPIRDALSQKFRRFSIGLTKSNSNISEERKAEIPTSIDFSKPFDFEGNEGIEDDSVGFGNPLFGQQPSRLSLTFDELPSPMDFGTDGFTGVTPSSDENSIFAESPNLAPKHFPPIRKKGNIELPDSSVTFFNDDDDDVTDVIPAESFPAIRRKSAPPSAMPVLDVRKRVSFDDHIESTPLGDYKEIQLEVPDIHKTYDDTDEDQIYSSIDVKNKHEKDSDA